LLIIICCDPLSIVGREFLFVLGALYYSAARPDRGVIAGFDLLPRFRAPKGAAGLRRFWRDL